MWASSSSPRTPRDVPAEVLGQLANRVQHALRAFTPEDAKALKSTVSTFPVSPYDLEEVLTSAGIGEAVVTVMNENGAPTPVAWTRMFSPQSTMGPSPAGLVEEIVKHSPLLGDYGTPIDSHSAFEKLSGSKETPTTTEPTTATGPDAGAPPAGRLPSQAEIDAEARRIEEEILGRPSNRQPTARQDSDGGRRTAPPAPPAGRKQQEKDEMMDFALKAAGTIGVELVRGLFGTQRRRRRRRW